MRHGALPGRAARPPWPLPRRPTQLPRPMATTAVGRALVGRCVSARTMCSTHKPVATGATAYARARPNGCGCAVAPPRAGWPPLPVAAAGDMDVIADIWDDPAPWCRPFLIPPPSPLVKNRPHARGRRPARFPIPFSAGTMNPHDAAYGRGGPQRRCSALPPRPCLPPPISPTRGLGKQSATSAAPLPTTPAVIISLDAQLARVSRRRRCRKAARVLRAAGLPPKVAASSPPPSCRRSRAGRCRRFDLGVNTRQLHRVPTAAAAAALQRQQPRRQRRRAPLAAAAVAAAPPHRCDRRDRLPPVGAATERGRGAWVPPPPRAHDHGGSTVAVAGPPRRGGVGARAAAASA